jgi:hypothetical protein
MSTILKTETVTCRACEATWCRIPGTRGRPLKTCSVACRRSAYVRTPAGEWTGPTAKSAEVGHFFNTLDKAKEKRLRYLPPELLKIFREFGYDPGPFEGFTSAELGVGSVIGSLEPWNA